MDRNPNTPRNRGEEDAPHYSPASPAEDARTIMLNRVSWGAVLAGVVVALVTHVILNLIGIGIGAATIEPTAGMANNPSPTSLSVGAYLWWTVSGIIAAATGGYAAGRLAGRPKESVAGWHGLTSWAFTTLVIFYLLTTTLGGLVGGAYRTVTDAASTVASASGSAIETSIARTADPFAAIEQSIRSTTGGTDPAALRDAAVAAMRAAVTGDQGQAQAARDRAAQAIAQAQNIPVDQARQQVAQYEQQYRQSVENARREAAEAADVAADGIATGALVSAIALLLGALSAWFSGRMGAVEPTLTARRFSFGVSRHGTA